MSIWIDLAPTIPAAREGVRKSGLEAALLVGGELIAETTAQILAELPGTCLELELHLGVSRPSAVASPG
jgi:hypothetical protein